MRTFSSVQGVAADADAQQMRYAELPDALIAGRRDCRRDRRRGRRIGRRWSRGSACCWRQESAIATAAAVLHGRRPDRPQPQRQAAAAAGRRSAASPGARQIFGVSGPSSIGHLRGAGRCFDSRRPTAPARRRRHPASFFVVKSELPYRKSS